MNLAALQALVDAGESQTLELKTSFDKATVESLVAFANAQGGTVLVGVMATLAQKQPESQPESNLSLAPKVLQLLSKAPMSKRDISAALGQTEVSGQLKETPGKTLGKTLGITLEKTPDLTLKRLRDAPRSSISELAQQLDKSGSAVEQAIRKLRAPGKLQRIGPAKRSHWQVIELKSAANPHLSCLTKI